MNKFYMNGKLIHKASDHNTKRCEVEKWVFLPHSDFERLKANPYQEHEAITAARDLMYELNSGSISIDGINISDVSRENVHDTFGMVLQDPWLITGTLRENIRYMSNVTDKQIMDICEKCSLSYFVSTLPDGLNTIIDENLLISSGQKQLITIARAMAKNAPMLILDEATSSVDSRTEIMIQKAMDKLCENRTSFVIAHRLSTIVNADMILYMRDGNIEEIC